MSCSRRERPSSPTSLTPAELSPSVRSDWSDYALLRRPSHSSTTSSRSTSAKPRSPGSSITWPTEQRITSLFFSDYSTTTNGRGQCDTARARRTILDDHGHPPHPDRGRPGTARAHRGRSQSPAELAETHRRHVRDDGRRQRRRPRRQPGRPAAAVVRLRLPGRRRRRHGAPPPRLRGQPGPGDLGRSPRPCRIRTTTSRAACRCRASSSPPAAPTGRRSPAPTPTATPSRSRAHGFFARMLQHEVGHLDGFLYVDMLVGRNARAAKKTIKRAGWGVPGLSWVPGTVEDPFGA